MRRPPTLTDGEAEVREWEPRDAACLGEAARDEYVAAVWGLPMRGDDAGAVRWIEAQRDVEASGRGISRAIAPAGAPAAGQIGLNHREEGRVSIYYWLVPSARGRGLTARAAGLLARWALTELGAPRLEARIEPGNAASRAIAARLGFTEEGLLRQFTEFGGRRRDVVMYSLLPADAAAARLPSPGYLAR